MNVRNWFVAPMIVAVVLGGGACRSQNTAEEQKKVDELQRQLDEAKQQLAAKEEQIQARAAEALPPAEQDVPGAAATSPAAAGSSSARSARKVTAQQGRAAADGSGAKPDTMDPADGQRDVDARQSEADARLQRELDSPKPVEYTIPAGTVIPVRATRELSTSQLATGATFTAVLERDLRVGGTVLAAQGAQVAGVVVSSDRGGRVKGLASLEVTIKSIAGRKGQTIRVKTDDYGVVAGKTTGRDMTRTGIMTGAGAVVGAIAGGAKGAAIGAGTGAAAGVGTNMATRGKAAVIPAETLMEFRLTAPSTVVYER